VEILSLFKDIDSAAQGVDGLIKNNIPEANITSLSAVHLPEGSLVRTEDRAWYKWFSVIGGFIGAGLGFFLGAITAMLYPLYTGDKPIVSPYPVAIITYEFTMLCAIAGAFIGMIAEMKKKRKGTSLYAVEIPDGAIGISVTDISANNLDQVKTILQKSGAFKIEIEEHNE
jgi:hypothetical protein